MKTIAVLCEEKEYLERLTSALLKVLPAGYGADGYTDIASFADREEPGRVKAVLLSDGCGTAEERTVLSEHMAVRRIPVWRLTPEASLSEEERCLFMYQPVDRMIDRLAEIFEFSHAGEASKEETAPSPCRVIGVLSLGGADNGTYAFSLAKQMAAKGRTMLLCVNPWPDGGREWTPADGDVSELLYLLKEHGARWYERERFCLRTVGNVRIVSGYTCVSDFGQFTEEDVGALLAGLEAAGYNGLVIDLGASPQPAFSECCEEIHVLGAGIGNRYRELERMVREEGLGERLRAVRTEATA